MKNIRILLLLAAFLALSSNAFAANSEAPQSIVINKIAAVVNGEMITLHELRQHAAAEFIRAGINPSDPAARNEVNMLMSKTLSVMIDDMLLRQEAERLQLKATDSEIENELRMLVQRNQTTMKAFEAQVVAQGGAMDMVRERIRHNILSQRIINFMIARKSVVTKEEINAYYEEHKNDFSAERSVDISLLIFSPSAKADDIHGRIIKGALSFEEAVKQYSEGPAVNEGGRLGMIKWEDLAAPFKSQIMDMRIGGVSAVFHANSRICMLKLNDATNGRSMTLEEATPEIERVLREPRLQERFIEYTQQLRSRAVIDIRL